MRKITAAGFSSDIRNRYVQKLKLGLKDLNAIGELLARKSAQRSDLDMLEREAHRLAGSGATYGYSAISATAFALEYTLRDGVDDPAEISALLLTMLRSILSAITESETGAAAPSTARQPRPAEYRPLILIVGEDAYLRERVAKFLKPFARVKCLASGEEASRAVQRQRFDLIVLDNEPATIGDGTLTRTATGKHQPTPIIVMTAPGQPITFNAYALGRVVKPFTSEILIERVKAMLSVHRPLVLVADDDPIIREVFSNTLRQCGVDVSVASSGSEALDMAHRLRPDAIILDRKMPQLDGMQVLSSIRTSVGLRDTPVMIVSARRSASDVVEGLACGADDYICKPFLPESVVNRCLKLLGGTGHVAA